MSRSHTWPDERLVKAAQDGDITSLTAVVMESQPHVRRFALSLCATPQDAEDAAQEALIILYRKIGTLRASGALASWMFRIVRNECLRYLRLFTSVSAAEAAGSEPAPSAEKSVLRRLDAERVAVAVS
ncbi:RNA polymerase sigma factor (sigma-70 family) [Streptomyces sp. V4I23]|nr:RNA polymerase sigma factor (sigma-70 family) [Streptomyces sp. V4I23]